MSKLVWISNKMTGRPEPQKWPDDYPLQVRSRFTVLAEHDLSPDEEAKSLCELAADYPPPEQPEEPVMWATGEKTCNCGG